MNSESIPLAARLRPQSIDDVVGQDHLIGIGKPLRIAVEQQRLFSFILWGPPGVGKTTIARIYAHNLNANFVEMSAVSTGIKEVRKLVEESVGKLVPTVLFLDEIHRWNKAQQDFLLPHVESGVITLIGATTENPSFEVISPLLSRMRVFVLKELSIESLKLLLQKSLEKIEHKSVSEEAGDFIVNYANGDARQLLTLIANTTELFGELTLENLKSTAQNLFIRYDKKGDGHYDTISAFIKSMRASNVDSAIYYLARMIEAGEDPKFIARRMVIFASEDVGLAQPTALVVANEVMRAVETIGLPECAINLAHGVAYLCTAPKSRSVYDAIKMAQADVRELGNLPIPLKIRNAPTDLMKTLGYGKDYEMYDKESLLPEKIKNKKYWKFNK
jgi:putative ATPase